MRDPRLDELIQMETWDWWKAQVFYLREKKDYADAEALFMEFKIPASDSKDSCRWLMSLVDATVHGLREPISFSH